MSWIPGAVAFLAAVSVAVAHYGAVQQGPMYQPSFQPQPSYQPSYQPAYQTASYQPTQVVQYPVPGQPEYNAPAFTNVKAGRRHGPFFDAYINNHSHRSKSRRHRRRHHSKNHSSRSHN